MADTASKVASKEHCESADSVSRKAEVLASYIRDSRHFIVFTGAGISTSAGIPDFRGPEGSWTLRAQGRQRSNTTTSTLRAIPTPAHMALVEMQNRGMLKYVVSQNCDGLHRRSGIRSENISEIHGNSNLEYCKGCSTEYLRDFRAVSASEKSIHDHRTGRKCAVCSGALFDTIINFGEPLPEKALYLAQEHARKADLCLVLGSSCTVTPANEIPEMVGRKTSARLVICNLQETSMDTLSELRVFSTADDLMIRVMDFLSLNVPRFSLRRRVAVRVETWENAHQTVTVRGVDAEGMSMTLLKSVKMEGTRRVSKTEPHVFHLRDAASPGYIVQLILEFMGHYGEPDLEISHEIDGAELEAHYAIEFDPYTGSWAIKEH
ncbi:hypothetical protein QQS21_010208 [Conoideocrella luteorostrata]|uniref:protein acetyllysine N-acetyltransferase n=1 Tax=Conoideocrella luteorostrata TaxID=1105319 RepID=A0AAJ0CI55_9HYPO|nr:hypothetical protein QQS21_010208 [Conoideocrella luteorostrata]